MEGTRNNLEDTMDNLEYDSHLWVVVELCNSEDGYEGFPSCILD